MKIIISGCAGKMGKELLKKALAEQLLGKIKLVGGTVIKGSHLDGKDLGTMIENDAINLHATSSLEKIIEQTDFVIDFTTPENSLHTAEICAKNGKGFICGTTGLSKEQINRLEELAKSTVVFWSPNISIGVNLLKRLVSESAKLLGNDFDCEILEIHHKHKVDSPSGTALMLAKEVSADQIYARQGVRKQGSVGISSLRCGEVVGEHTVIFAGSNERIELKHIANNRSIYVDGAFRALYSLAGKGKGKLYNMDDL